MSYSEGKCFLISSIHPISKIESHLLLNLLEMKIDNLFRDENKKKKRKNIENYFGAINKWKEDFK